MLRCTKAPNSAMALCHVLLQLSRQPSTASLENLFSEHLQFHSVVSMCHSQNMQTPKSIKSLVAGHPTFLACLLHSSDTSLGLSLLQLDWPWMTPSHSLLQKHQKTSTANLASHCCQVSAPTVNKDQSCLEPPPWCARQGTNWSASNSTMLPPHSHTLRSTQAS